MASGVVATAAFVLAAGLAALCPPARAQAPVRPPVVVAAENFYGDVAHQIGGADARVVSIISNPEQDPHEFEASPSTARSVAGARIVAYNGADYDPWMPKLLAASPSADRRVIVVADLVGKKAGDNPHLWYNPEYVAAYARALTDALAATDPAHEAAYRQRANTFFASLQSLLARIAELQPRANGTPVAATEPVFGYLLAALGMSDREPEFQLAIMNGTEPSASSVAAFENDLRTKQVKLLIYNSQASSPVASRMEALARANRIPVIGATETEPAGRTYQAWIAGTLDAIDRALPK
jgi:zinc/manganese transport system substrate-binding protein